MSWNECVVGIFLLELLHRLLSVYVLFYFVFLFMIFEILFVHFLSFSFILTLLLVVSVYYCTVNIVNIIVIYCKMVAIDLGFSLQKKSLYQRTQKILQSRLFRKTCQKLMHYL